MRTKLSMTWLYALLVCLLFTGCDNGNQENNAIGESSIIDKVKYADIEAQLDAKERKLLATLKEQPLTEDKLLSYIDALQSVLQATGEEDLKAFTRRHQLYSQVRHAIEATGWTPEDFYWTGRKIAAVWSMVASMENIKPENIKEQYQTQTQAAIREFENMLEDPNIPESSKEEIRKSIQQLKESEGGFRNFETKKWQEKVKNTEDKLNYLLQKMATPQEAAVVKTHKKEIESIVGLLDPSLILEGIGNDPDFAE